MPEYSAGSGPGSDPVRTRFKPDSGVQGARGVQGVRRVQVFSTCSACLEVFSRFSRFSQFGQAVQGVQETVRRVFGHETKMIHEKMTRKDCDKEI